MTLLKLDILILPKQSIHTSSSLMSDPVSVGDEKLQRWRTPHAVPLGSIFVWSLEGLILSAGFFIFTIVTQEVVGNPVSAGEGSSVVNVVDITFSVVLMVANLINLICQLVVCNLFNSRKWASLAGKLHSASSNALCSVTFMCAFTYLSLYLDACAGSSAEDKTCIVLFRTTPMAHIVVGTEVVYIMIMFLVSLALAFVSTPQDETPCYVFISKGTLLMSITIFGWSLPALMSVGRKGCAGLDKGSGTSMVVFSVFSFIVGMGECIVDSLGVNMYDASAPQANGLVYYISHLVVDILFVLLTGIMLVVLGVEGLTENSSVGRVGLLFSIVTSVIGLGWCFVDIVVDIVWLVKRESPWRPMSLATQPQLGLGSGGSTARSSIFGQRGGGGYAPVSTTSSDNDHGGNNINSSSSAYGEMKKGDSMPPYPHMHPHYNTSSVNIGYNSVDEIAVAGVAGGRGQLDSSTMFINDDVRSSLLRQRVFPS